MLHNWWLLNSKLHSPLVAYLRIIYKTWKKSKEQENVNKYILVWRAMLFMIYKSTCNLYHFIISKSIVYLAHKCMLKPFKSSFNAISKVIFYTLQIISLTFFFNFAWYSEFFWRTWTLNFMKMIKIILYDSVFFLLTFT